MLPYTKLAALEDFAHPDLRPVLRRVYAHELSRCGPDFPAGFEVRKQWEVAMAVRTLTDQCVLRPDAEVLGIGAGNEPTSFYLTNYVRRVFATDLYLAPGWEQSANAGMMTGPGRYWPAAWNPRRLVVQHMDGRELRYEDGSFDGAFSSGSIEHFGGHADVRRAAREAHRVLKPGGVLSIATEYRLGGPGPGMPGTLMFDEGELRELIVGAADWELIGPVDLRCSAATRATEQPFEGLAASVQAHIAAHGEILYHKLTFPKYPVLVMRHGGLVWGSVHLALRKRR